MFVCSNISLGYMFAALHDLYIFFFHTVKGDGKKRVSFSISTKILLLKEVLDKTPFLQENPHDVWGSIAETLQFTCGGKFTARSVKEHFELMLKHFRNENTENLKR